MDIWDNIAIKHLYKALRKKKIQNVFLNRYTSNGAWHITHFETRDTALETEVKIQVRGLSWPHCEEKYINCHFSDPSWDVLCIALLHYSEHEPHSLYIIPRKSIKQAEGRYRLCSDSGNVLYTKGGLIRLDAFPFAKEYFDLQFRNRWEFIDTTGKYFKPVN